MRFTLRATRYLISAAAFDSSMYDQRSRSSGGGGTNGAISPGFTTWRCKLGSGTGGIELLATSSDTPAESGIASAPKSAAFFGKISGPVARMNPGLPALCAASNAIRTTSSFARPF